MTGVQTHRRCKQLWRYGNARLSTMLAVKHTLPGSSVVLFIPVHALVPVPRPRSSRLFAESEWGQLIARHAVSREQLSSVGPSTDTKRSCTTWPEAQSSLGPKPPKWAHELIGEGTWAGIIKQRH
jgi:hypothetical protein